VHTTDENLVLYVSNVTHRMKTKRVIK